MIKSMMIALAMYSKIPVPKVEWTDDGMKYALCFFPVVGIVEGLLFAALWMMMDHLGFGSLFRAAVLTALPVIITGGIHMDGFLDTMDALSSWQPRERKLEILKDSHTGAFAIIGGCLYVLLYAGGVSEIQGKQTAMLVGTGFVLSRILSAASLSLLKNAKKDGLAYTFMSGAHKNGVRAGLAAELFAVAGCMFFLNPLTAGVMIILAAATWVYYWRMSYRQFGGITGDLAGFFLQVCELLMLYGAVTAERLGSL